VNNYYINFGLKVIHRQKKRGEKSEGKKAKKKRRIPGIRKSRIVMMYVKKGKEKRIQSVEMCIVGVFKKRGL
jgi:hypothetical protein